MKKHGALEEYVAVVGMMVAVLLGLLILKIAAVERAIRAQLEYQVQYDMCIQEAMRYGTVCQVERDTDGTYNWYYYPGEQSMDTKGTEF